MGEKLKSTALNIIFPVDKKNNTPLGFKLILALAVFCLFSLPAFASDESAVGIWHMDEGSGATAYDSSPNNNDGTINGAGWVDGVSAKALYFDGIDDYAEVPNNSSLQLDEDLTLAFWLKPANVGSNRLNPLDKSYGGEFALTIEIDGRLSYYHGTKRQSGYYWGWAAFNSGTLINGGWQYIVITREAQSCTVKSYLNGQLKKSAIYSSDSNKLPSKSTYLLRIAKGYTARSYGGIIDEVKVYSGALTLDEITEAYQSSKPPTYYVSPTGNDANNGLTPETPFRTIQKAANAAVASQVIEVQAGTYNESVLITTSGTQDNLIIFRANGEVIIDGENSRAYCIKLDGADYIRIDGFACRNSTATGILLDNTANYNIITSNASYNHPETGIKLKQTSRYNTISYNKLYNNTGGSNAWGYRVCGIYVFGYSHYNTITNNEVYDNSTGIWLEGNSSNCTIINNKSCSNVYGGFIMAGGTNNNIISYNLSYNNSAFGLELCYSMQNNLVNNNIIYNNGTNGIQLNNTATNNIIKNNIIVGNGSSSSSRYGVFIESGSDATLSFNNIYNNSSSGIQSYGGVTERGVGDISLDPQFKSTDPENPDFLKLKSLANGDSIESPCVDGGDPADTPGTQSGRRIDIGAFDEYSHSPIQGGLMGEYYNNIDFSSLALVRVDPRVNFDWNSFTPEASLEVDTFSVRWTGQIRIDKTAAYTFYLTTDDGSRLWIDGQLIIDKWFDQGPTEYSANIDLTEGYHDIKYEFYENGGWAVAKLYWSNPYITKEVVPSNHLYYFGRLPQDDYVQGGLKGNYYNSLDFSSQVITRVDPGVNFDWGTNMADASLGNDIYSIKWKGKVKIDTADTYTFYTNTDDGLRLWINNRLLVDAWYDQGATEHSGSLYLEPGLYDIELDYYENGGLAAAKLLWSSSAVTKQIIPSTHLYCERQEPLIGGLLGEYYDNIDFTNRLLKRLDPKIDFDWISAKPDTDIQADTYSVRWTGEIKIDTDGNYTFYINSDDGAKLWIDDQLLINTWWNHGPYETSAVINLTGGWHDIKIEYFENGGWAAIKLAWQKPGSIKEIIPAEHLRFENKESQSFLCHLENEFDVGNPTVGHNGEVVTTGSGEVNFVEGKYGNGVELNGSSGNTELIKFSQYDLNREQGTISFWFKPNWNSDDGLWHQLFDTPWNINNAIQVFKYTNNRLYWKICRNGTQYVIYSDTSPKWNAGEWHHLTFSWGPASMKFYLDGNEIIPESTFGSGVYYGGLIDELSGDLRFGGDGASSNCVFDEIRISKIQEAPEVIPPTVNIISPANGFISTVSPIDVSGTVNEENVIVRVNGVDAVVSDGSFIAYGVSLNPGSNTITATATDNWGNKGTHSINVIYETTAPTKPVVTDDGIYTTSNIQLHAIWSSDDPESGITEYQYSIGTTQGATDIVDWVSVGINTEVIHTDLVLNHAQLYYINVEAKNAVNMWSEVGSSDGIYYNRPPTITEITPPDGSVFQAGEIILIQVTANDLDADSLDYQFKIDGEIKQSWSASSSYPWQTGEEDIGTRVVTCETRDNYGGLISQDVTYEIILDNTPPTGTIIINNNDEYTNSQDVNLTLSATDNLSGVEEMKFSNDGTNWSTAEGYSTSKTWSLTTGDGTKTVYVKYKDGAGNWSNPISDTIILDTTDPVVSITSHANGEISTTTPIIVSGPINDNLDDSPTVKVNGENAEVIAGQFSKEVNLTLGNNPITAIATDAAGNSFSFGSITVIYDNTKPTTPVVTDDGEYSTLLTELHATWSSDDPETGITEYKYSIGTSAGATDVVDWISTGTNIEVTHTGLTLTAGQAYYFNVKAVNGAALESNEGHSDGIIASDGTTLLIEITSHENNALVNSSPITVEGTVSSDSATVTVNSTSATVIDNIFSVSVEITEGTNIITAKATLDDQTATNRIDVILDVTPPSINVFTPDENATTRSNVIYGRVSDDVISINVNGTSAELIERNEYNKYFLAQPSLAEGSNTITIEVEDEAGNTAQKTHSFTCNTTSPKVTITNPANNSTINLSPITITGTIITDITYISVEAHSAIIEETTFTANYIRLSPAKSVITATGQDESDNKYQDTIIINSPDLKHYELIKVSGDIAEYEEGLPEAGSNWDLTIKLYVNDAPALNEEIEFTTTQGNGILSSQYALTDIDGLAAVTLTTDTDASITNKVEAKSSTHPNVTTVFSVDTKPAQPANLIKITDETQTPTPGAAIPIIAKLTDAYNNIITDEQIDFSVSQGTGTLSANSATTNYYGEAKVDFTAPVTPDTLTQITASSAINPSIITTFNITTSPDLTVTIDDIIAKVNTNDEKIEDIKADITVTSDADFLPPTMQLKIWQKGDKQKVEEISPESGVYIRPDLDTGDVIQIDKQIISYNSTTQAYVIKSKLENQTEEKPYQLLYIDCSKGIVTKVEYYQEAEGIEALQTIEYLDFVQLPEAENAWVYDRKIEKFYEGGQLQYTTTEIISNRQVNTGIPDSEFMQ